MNHFTPEYFGSLNSEKDEQIFSFKNALPYAHHNAVDSNKTYLNYFGVQCFPIIGVVTNAGGTADKSFTNTDVYCKQVLFIMQHLETSMNQKSQVFEGQFNYNAGKYSAPYLCDIQNHDGTDSQDGSILDGDTLYGKWLKALYIPKPGYDGEYFVLTSIVSYFFGNASGLE